MVRNELNDFFDRHNLDQLKRYFRKIISCLYSEKSWKLHNYANLCIIIYRYYHLRKPYHCAYICLIHVYAQVSIIRDLCFFSWFPSHDKDYCKIWKADGNYSLKCLECENIINYTQFMHVIMLKYNQLNLFRFPASNY